MKQKESTGTHGITMLDLFRVAFPPRYRSFPGKRWVSTGLRTAQVRYYSVFHGRVLDAL